MDLAETQLSAGARLEFGPVKRSQSEAILKASRGHALFDQSQQNLTQALLQELANRQAETGYELTKREARAITSLQAGKAGGLCRHPAPEVGKHSRRHCMQQCAAQAPSCLAWEQWPQHC